MQPVNIISLEQLYLAAIATACQSLKMDCVHQEIRDDAQAQGRLWLVTPQSTVPIAQLAFNFTRDYVTLGIITRDQRELVRTVKYAEGVDGFLQDMTRFFQAGRIANNGARQATPSQLQQCNAGAPLRDCAARLTHPAQPAYQRCDSNVFPSWTAKRRLSVPNADRPKLPAADVSAWRFESTLEFVRYMEQRNNWAPTAYSCEAQTLDQLRQTLPHGD